MSRDDRRLALPDDGDPGRRDEYERERERRERKRVGRERRLRERRPPPPEYEEDWQSSPPPVRYYPTSQPVYVQPQPQPQPQVLMLSGPGQPPAGDANLKLKLALAAFGCVFVAFSVVCFFAAIGANVSIGAGNSNKKHEKGAGRDEAIHVLADKLAQDRQREELHRQQEEQRREAELQRLREEFQQGRQRGHTTDDAERQQQRQTALARIDEVVAKIGDIRMRALAYDRQAERLPAPAHPRAVPAWRDLRHFGANLAGRCEDAAKEAEALRPSIVTEQGRSRAAQACAKLASDARIEEAKLREMSAQLNSAVPRALPPIVPR